MPAEKIYSAIIIGAGISGLSLAHLLQRRESEAGGILILEKSRGVGGRLATRRTLNTKLDHGAQFYSLQDDEKKLGEFTLASNHQHWQEKNLVHCWFKQDCKSFYCASQGMTSLAKDLVSSFSASVSVLLEKQVERLYWHDQESYWSLYSTLGEEWKARRMIITAPLPQALQLLDRSAVLYPLSLQKIHYDKALIGLFTLLDSFHSYYPSRQSYLEGLNSQNSLFSLSDQQAKGVSLIPALTVCMDATFSQQHFDGDEQDVLNLIKENLLREFPLLKIASSELKKWRYSRPSLPHSHHTPHHDVKNNYLELPHQLYLMGDAFTSGSIKGAVTSALSLSEHLCQAL